MRSMWSDLLDQGPMSEDEIRADIAEYEGDGHQGFTG